MTKAELAIQVSRAVGVTRKEAQLIVATVLDSIVVTLREGDKVEIRGFGTFRTRMRRPRVARNPRSGERVVVPEKTVPFFKPSKSLRDAVSQAALTER